MNLSPRLNAALACSALATMMMAAPPPPPQGPPRDTGVRPGVPAAGRPLTGLPGLLLALFNNADATFNEIDSVPAGLGPGFNMNSCGGCHGFPAPGGSSPQINPQVAVANLAGATNAIPSFITTNGPVREARFKLNPDGSADGGVHDLFVITGRADAPLGCKLAQTDFAPQVANGNVTFRIPTPVFGAGLIESIPDAAILANVAANAAAKSHLGISGHENRSGNDGTIARFGWKAQNKSLLIFAGEAYNVEQGVTNEAFPDSRQTDPACDTNGLPEDHTDLTTGAASDIVNLALYMRLLAAPQPVNAFGPVPATSVQNGHNVFLQVGCALCHTPGLTTGNSSIAALSNQTANLFSDLLVHDMGSGLADGIAQGNATGSEFRTAPLWGAGQRIFFLHDGRTTDLMQAIQSHASPGSEATAVIGAFNAMSPRNQQDLLNFLRSL
jgi:CxxC motif-containing protein (DUF1111 family)